MSPSTSLKGHVFDSKIDTWLLIILVALPIAATFSCARSVVAGTPGSWIMALLQAALGIVLPLWIAADTRYVVTNETLIVRSGPFRWHIALAGITGVEPTRSRLSAPALSMDRLKIISRGGGLCLVSPKDKQGFLRELKNHGVRMA